MLIDHYSIRSACFCRARECRSTSSTMPLMPSLAVSSVNSFPSSASSPAGLAVSGGDLVPVKGEGGT